MNQTTKAMLTNFINTHGVVGLFKQGVAPEMLRATLMRVSKFFCFPICHNTLFKRDPSKGSPGTRAIAGALASVPETLAITPMEVGKIGLQLDQEKRFNNNSKEVIRYIYRKRGFLGLFTGYAGIQYRQASWSGGYFCSLNTFDSWVSNALRRMYNLDPSSKLTSGQQQISQLISGFFAGVFGSVFNTPGDVIRTSMQKKVLADVSQTAPARFSLQYAASGVTDFFVAGKEIVRAKGIPGLYYGFVFKSLHLGGSGALLALLIPMFKNVMGVRRE